MSQEWDVAKFFNGISPTTIGLFNLERVEQTSPITFRLYFEPSNPPPGIRKERLNQEVNVRWRREKAILSLHTSVETEVPISQIGSGLFYVNIHGNQPASGHVCRFSILDDKEHPDLKWVTLAVTYEIGLYVMWMYEQAKEELMRELVLGYAIRVFMEGTALSVLMTEAYWKNIGKI